MAQNLSNIVCHFNKCHVICMSTHLKYGGKVSKHIRRGVIQKQLRPVFLKISRTNMMQKA